MGVLAALGLLCSAVAVASPLHKPIKSLLHKLLTTLTIRQLPFVAATQGYCSRWLDLAVLLSAATITIEVYIVLLSLLIWHGSTGVVAVCGMLPQLALAGYVVFALKDLLESPRPADCLKLCPNAHVIVRDPSGDIEDGVPSAHCCGAVSLLLYGIHAAAAAGLLPDQGAKTTATCAAVAWTAWLAWGRAYLGLHTPFDLATGSLLGWSLVELWVRVEGPYRAHLEASLAAPAWQLPLQVLALSALLMRCYPMPGRWTTCYNYATAWAGGWAGSTLAWAWLQQQAAAGGAVASAADGSSSWALAGLRVALGLGLVVATKLAAKAAALVVLRHAFALVPLPLRCLWQPPIVGAVLRQAGAAGGGASSSAAAEAREVAAAVQDMQERQAVMGRMSVAAAADATGKQQQQEAAAAAGGSKDPHGTAGGLPHKLHSSSGASSGLWGLRHGFDGTPNDVAATARWLSYVAVGGVIVMWRHWGPLLLDAALQGGVYTSTSQS